MNLYNVLYNLPFFDLEVMIIFMIWNYRLYDIIMVYSAHVARIIKHYYLSQHCIDTTGLQSSFALLGLNGNIIVTCTFATGASSTGCQVTIFYIMSDKLLKVISKNITRPNGTNQVHY